MTRRSTLFALTALLPLVGGLIAPSPASGHLVAKQEQHAQHRVADPSFGAALVGRAPTGKGPAATLYDASTDTIYVANGFGPDSPSLGGNTVTVIDGRRCDARSVAGCKGPWPTITVGELPSALAVDPARHTLFATSWPEDGPGSVAVVDISHCRAGDTTGCGSSLATIPVGTGPYALHLDDASHTAYIANFIDNTVSVIDTAACNAAHLSGCPATPAPSFAVPDGPGDLDVNSRTHTAYVATLIWMRRMAAGKPLPRFLATRAVAEVTR